jgi:hypothetical protein
MSSFRDCWLAIGSGELILVSQAHNGERASVLQGGVYYQHGDLPIGWVMMYSFANCDFDDECRQLDLRGEQILILRHLMFKLDKGH